MKERQENVNYFIGTIVEVEDRALYRIKADIPGEFEGITAFPVRGEIDEPKVGDLVLLRSFDPIYHSYFLYQKLKENDFIGFRSLGKLIEVDPNGEYIQIATFDPSTEYTDGRHGSEYRPEPQDWIKLDQDGNMEVYLRKDKKILVGGDGDLTVNGNINITINGNADVTINGKTVVKSPSIEIKGPGLLTCKGTVLPSSTGGPFIAVNVAPPPGTPLISGDTIILS